MLVLGSIENKFGTQLIFQCGRRRPVESLASPKDGPGPESAEQTKAEQTEAEQTKARLVRAEKLTNGLASEGVRWYEEEAEATGNGDSGADAGADLEQGQGEREGGEEEKDGEAEAEAGSELPPIKPPPSAKKNTVMPLIAD